MNRIQRLPFASPTAQKLNVDRMDVEEHVDPATRPPFAWKVNASRTVYPLVAMQRAAMMDVGACVAHAMRGKAVWTEHAAKNAFLTARKRSAEEMGVETFVVLARRAHSASIFCV